MRQRDPRQHNEKHLAFIRSLPCVACENGISTEAAHIRMSDQRAAKNNPGVGQKPHDRWTVPLCSVCHREQHDVGEKQFWDSAMIDPVFVAMALFLESGNDEAAAKIIKAQH